MKKRFLAMLVALCLLLTLLPGTALATDAELLQTVADAGLLRYTDFTDKNLDDAVTRMEHTELIAALMNIEPDFGSEPEFSDCGLLTETQKGLIVATTKFGYMSGYSDGTFSPEGQMTRAECVVIYCKLLHLEPVNEPTPFEDVPESHWAAPYIAAFCKASLGPITDTKFYPDNAATKRDALQNALALEDMNLIYPTPPVSGGSSGKIMATPTDLEWGVNYGTGSDEPQSVPGYMSWKVEGRCQNKFRVEIFRTDTPEYVFFTEGSNLEPHNMHYNMFTFVTEYLESDTESGEYYFTVQSLSDDETIQDSGIARSGIWNYIKPDAQLESPMSPKWQWPYVTWTAPEVTDHVAGYGTHIFFSEDGSIPRLIRSNISTGTSTSVDDSLIKEYGDGYYYYKVRTLSDNISQYRHSEWVAGDNIEDCKVLVVDGKAYRYDSILLSPAVCYVPYSADLSSSGINDAYILQSGKLPAGMELTETGVLQGVPTEQGTFAFTIQSMDETYSKPYVLRVLDSSDPNVDQSTDDGYAIIQPVENMSTVSYEDQLFWLEGAFNEFRSLYIDGKLLTRDVDYDAVEGSTKITIRAETFSRIGTGTHTLSAEFRTTDTNELKVASQNFTISAPGGGGGSGTYTITVQQSEGGKVSASPVSAAAGATVTLTVTPDDGYVLKELTAGNNVVLTKVSETTYTFTMPRGNVTVSAVFDNTGLPFVDVLLEHWFYDAVRYTYENGLMSGISSTAFAPDAVAARAQLVTVLWRLDGMPQVDLPVQFDDMAQGTWYSDAIAWAADAHIIEGYGDGTFGIDRPITREEFVAILYQYASMKNYDVSPTADLSVFTDSGMVSDYAIKAVAWANAEGILYGTTETTLSPNQEITRAQTAAILMRFCGNIEK